MTFENAVKTLSLFGAVATFFWGVMQYSANEKKQAETRRIEATKPFLNRQLELYTTATKTAATLATGDDSLEKTAALKKFWSLYWGELALVEDEEVETAMVRMGKGVEKGVSREELQKLSLKLAHAIRDSLADSWGVKEWRNPRRRAASEQPE